MLTSPPRDTDVPLSNTSRPTEILLSWTVHRLRGQSHRLPRIGLAVLSVLALGLLVLHSLLFALSVAAALVLSLSEFLFPLTYTLTRHGATARQGILTWEIAWADVRHAYLAPDGIKLSPLGARGTCMEPLRGVFLCFGDNEQAVIAAVRRFRAEAGCHG